MSYGFTDTTGRPEIVLPAEALSINGEYIENQILGYRTLSVAGRELFGAEVTTEEVGRRNGTVYRSRRYPERVITVNYQLIASSNDEFRRYYEKLNNLLDVEQAILIFADDPDYYFVGTPSEASEIETGRNAVTGSFSIICADPFKRSVEEHVAEPDSNGKFQIDYHGNFPSYPIFEAHFYKTYEKSNSSGKCGYVAFLNENAKVLQFGKPEITDEIIELAKYIKTTSNVSVTSEQLLSESFDSTTGWSVNTGTTSDSSYVKTGTIKSAVFTGESDKALQPNSYGTGSKVWHGPSATYNLPADSQGVSAHDDWTIDFALRFGATNASQQGVFQAFVTDASGNYVAGLEVIKSNAGSMKGAIKFYYAGATGIATIWQDIDLSETNLLFGKNIPRTVLNYKTGQRYTTLPNAMRGITIKKKGNSLSFTIGNRIYSGKVTTSVKASKVSFYFGQYDIAPNVADMGVYSCKFTSNSVTKTWDSDTVAAIQAWLTEDGIFGTNDVLVADCGDASVWLRDAYDDDSKGVSRSELGALGNEWEDFALVSGSNSIATQYSHWVTSQYAPTFKIRYREVFL